MKSYINISFYFFFKFPKQLQADNLDISHVSWNMSYSACLLQWGCGCSKQVGRWIWKYDSWSNSCWVSSHHTLQNEDNRKGWMCSFSGSFSSQMSKGFSSSLNALIHIHIFPTPLTYWKKLRVIHTWLKLPSTAAWDVFQAALVFQRPCCCDIMQLPSSDRSVFIIAKSFLTGVPSFHLSHGWHFEDGENGSNSIQWFTCRRPWLLPKWVNVFLSHCN